MRTILVVLVLAIATVIAGGCGSGGPGQVPAPDPQPAAAGSAPNDRTAAAQSPAASEPTVGSGDGTLFDPYIIVVGQPVSAHLADYYVSSFQIHAVYYAAAVQPGRTYRVRLYDVVADFDPDLDEWTRRVKVSATDDLGSEVQGSSEVSDVEAEAEGLLQITSQTGRLYVSVESYHADVSFALVVEDAAALATAAAPAEESARSGALPGMFSDPQLGYAIAYPEDWIVERPSGFTIVIGGPEGTEAYYATINVQNLASRNLGGVYGSVDDVYAEFKGQVEGAGGRTYDRQDYALNWSGGVAAGLEFMAEYRLQGQPMRQWIVVIQRNDNIFHQFSYTAPADLYEQYLATAIAIHDSWTLMQ